MNTSTATTPGPLLVKVKDAAQMLGLSENSIYELAASGAFTKRYVGSGTRNFRLEVSELESYVKGLPTEPSPGF